MKEGKKQELNRIEQAVVGVIAFAVLFGVYSMFKGSGEPEPEDPQDLAWMYCQQRIERAARDPDSVKFHGVPRFTTSDPSKITVALDVSMTNGFGARIREVGLCDYSIEDERITLAYVGGEQI